MFVLTFSWYMHVMLHNNPLRIVRFLMDQGSVFIVLMSGDTTDRDCKLTQANARRKRSPAFSLDYFDYPRRKLGRDAEQLLS